MPSLRRRITGTPFEEPVRRAVDVVARLWPRGRRRARDARLLDDLLVRTLPPDGTLVDVGAHRGEFLRRALAVAPAGHHIAVEPLPEFAAVLRQRFPGVAVIECALSDHVGRTTFEHVPHRPAWSGLRRQDYPGDWDSETLDVEIRTLDDVLEGRPVDLVKIDVEGAELEVLRGASYVLERIRPVVVFEHASIHADAYGTSAAAVHRLLSDVGYEVLRLDGGEPLSEATFTDLCRHAAESEYGADAQTNFVATPGRSLP